MTGILLTCLLLILLIGALLTLLINERTIALWLYKRYGPRRWLVVTRKAETPAERPDPVDEHFTSTTGSVYVKSDHPEDCAQTCCWEIRLNELVDQYDWHAAEYEMRKTK